MMGLSKAALISIRPKWCEKIASGEKTIEVRKTRPKMDTPFKCYIYCTQSGTKKFWTGPRYSYADDHSHNQFDRCGNGKVIGEFVCDGIYPVRYTMDGFADVVDCNRSLLKPSDFITYGKGKPLYGWHITDLRIYDTPRELSEFKPPFEKCADKVCDEFLCASCEYGSIKRPPQSWCYVEEVP